MKLLPSRFLFLNRVVNIVIIKHGKADLSANSRLNGIRRINKSRSREYLKPPKILSVVCVEWKIRGKKRFAEE